MIKFRTSLQVKFDKVEIYGYNIYLFNRCILYIRPKYTNADGLTFDTEFHFGIFRKLKYLNLKDLLCRYLPFYGEYRLRKAFKAFNKAK